MVLMKLRLNLEENDLAYRFNVSQQPFPECSINGYHTWVRNCLLSFNGLNEMNFEKHCQCHSEPFLANVYASLIRQIKGGSDGGAGGARAPPLLKFFLKI